MKKDTVERGFTLIELILVIFIVVAAIAVVFPSFRRATAAFDLRATGRDLLGVLRYAREHAITEQKEMKVVIDKEAQNAVVSDAVGDGSRTFTMPKDVEIQLIALYGEPVLQGPLIIRFLPNGSSEQATILLKGKTGAQLQVVTDPITGGSRIQTDQVEGAR
jgi:general secretion pathway protein H